MPTHVETEEIFPYAGVCRILRACRERRRERHNGVGNGLNASWRRRPAAFAALMALGRRARWRRRFCCSRRGIACAGFHVNSTVARAIGMSMLSRKSAAARSCGVICGEMAPRDAPNVFMPILGAGSRFKSLLLAGAADEMAACIGIMLLPACLTAALFRYENIDNLHPRSREIEIGANASLRASCPSDVCIVEMAAAAKYRPSSDSFARRRLASAEAFSSVIFARRRPMCALARPDGSEIEALSLSVFRGRRNLGLAAGGGRAGCICRNWRGIESGRSFGGGVRATSSRPASSAKRLLLILRAHHVSSLEASFNVSSGAPRRRPAIGAHANRPSSYSRGLPSSFW